MVSGVVLGIFKSNGACDNAHAGAGVGVGVKLADVGLLAIPFVAGPCKPSKTPYYRKYFLLLAEVIA